MVRFLVLGLLVLVAPGHAAPRADTSTPLIWVEFDIDRSPSQFQGQTFDHPDVCVSLPEVNNRQNKLAPAGGGSNGISGPGRLMRRDASGKVSVLYDCAARGQICMPTDPRLSFDGSKVAFTLYRGSEWDRACGSNNRILAGAGAGASIAVHDLATGKTTEWPFVPGRHDVTPVFVNQDGRLRIMFSSDRDREYEPVLPRISPQGYPNLQTFIAELDGSNVVKTGYHDVVSFYGGYQIRDGRVIGSCAQWGHDLAYIGYGPTYTNYPGTLLNQWWVCAQDPWGGSQESSFGAHYKGRALHWVNQLSDGRLAVGEYYRGNHNQGAGTIFLWSPRPFTVEGVPVRDAAGKYDALNPRDFLDAFPWANANDEKSHFDARRGRYQGKVRDPVGLPGGELGFVWCRGMCSRQFGLKPDGLDAFVELGPRPEREPVTVEDPVGVEIGIYKLPADKIPSKDYAADPIVMVDKPGVAEYGAIYGGPYLDVYGQARPDDVRQPRSADGKCHLQIASQRSDTTGYHRFHGSYRWGHQELSPLMGKEVPGVRDEDVRYIRITRLLPNTTRQRNFAGKGNQWGSVWGYRGRILGDAPVETDGSAKIEVPCDVPWLLAGLNAEHEVIKRDMMPQSLRPGTTLTCGGCHLHNDKDAMPAFSDSIAAGKPATALGTPKAQPEYYTDIVPILHRRCAGCHSGPTPAGGIDFADHDERDGTSTRTMLLEDHKQETNPRKVRVHDRSEGYNEKAVYWLDRPHVSWLVNGSFAADSGLYWYFRNRRTDYARNEDYPADYDFNSKHPQTEATPEEVATVRDWIDTGAFYDPTVPAPRLDGPTISLAAPDSGSLLLVADEASTEERFVCGAGRIRTQPPGFIVLPREETYGAGNWGEYVGYFDIAAEDYYDNHGVNFPLAYSVAKPLPPSPRLCVHVHGSSARKSATMFGRGGAFGPARGMCDIEVRNQDAEAHDGAWREWWAFSRNGEPYPVRRNVASVECLLSLFPQIDIDRRGIVVKGGSMGGGGALFQTMLWPEPWRSKIAWASMGIGAVMPRLTPKMYVSWPPDAGKGAALWDSIDFTVQAASDPVVRGMHYRHAFSTTDSSFTLNLHDKDPANDFSSQIAWVNVCAKHKLSCAATWVANGHQAYERGVNLPGIERFEVPEQDVTLDRAHPAFSESTGDWPPGADQRVDIATYPRGHYNLGLVWDHAKIVDSEAELVFPLRYLRHTGIGGGVPDQPERITVSVTPRRARHFAIRDGETIRWKWDGGARSGTAVVRGDTVTAEGIPLVAGEKYKRLRFHK